VAPEKTKNVLENIKKEAKKRVGIEVNIINIKLKLINGYIRLHKVT
jgi:uncharacterized alkaline shock family protein YloU